MQIFKFKDKDVKKELQQIGVLKRSGHCNDKIPNVFKFSVPTDWVRRNEYIYYLVHDDDMELPIYPEYEWKIECDATDTYYIIYRHPPKDFRYRYENFYSVQAGLTYYDGSSSMHRWWSMSSFPSLCFYTPRKDKTINSNIVSYSEYTITTYPLISPLDMSTLTKLQKVIDPDKLCHYIIEQNDSLNTIRWEYNNSFSENLEYFRNHVSRKPFPKDIFI